MFTLLNELLDKKERMHNFDKAAQKVWQADTLEAKKAIIQSDMIDKFGYPEKAAQFTEKLKKIATKPAADKLAADLMQLAHGNRVVK